MPRSTRDSDEEVETKPGRKTRGLAGLSAHDLLGLNSPLRRSNRIKPASKRNESSPESPVSDTSNASNSQPTRTTRRRVGAMDPAVTTETHRSLRSRKNSVSSDVSEATEVETGLATPSKRSRRSIATALPSADTPKANTRTSRRLTRAGSEAKSPPLTRTVSRTRASSMGPESISDEKTKERTQREPMGTPIKTRRRASMVPAEATVVEEKEDLNPVVQLERTLMEVDEDDETDTKNFSPDSVVKNKTPTSQTKIKESRKSVGEKRIEGENKLVKGSHDSPAENISSESSENVVVDNVVDDAKTKVHSDKTILETNEKTTTENNVTDIEHSVHNTTQALSQSCTHDVSKELGVKIENLLNSSMEAQERSLSNKENQAVNIITDVISDRTTENIISSALVQSPKLPASPVLADISIKGKYKSPANDTTIKRRQSKELSESVISDTINSPENANNSVIIIGNKENLECSSDMSLQLVVSQELDSSENAALNESANISSAEGCSTSDLLNNSNKSVTSTAQNEVPAEKVHVVHKDEAKMEIESEEKEIVDEKEVSDKTSEDPESEVKDVSMSVTGNTTDTSENKEHCKETENETLAESGDCEIKDKNKTLDTPEETNEENKLVSTDTVSSELSVTDAQSSITHDKDKTLNSSDNKEDAKNVSAAMSISSDEPVNLNSSKTEDDTVNVVKSSQSSIVTESPAEPTEDLPNKEELVGKDSILELFLPSKRRSTDKLKLKKNQEKSEEDHDIQRKDTKNMVVDDSDSDTNIGNLFQDIPPKEWKKKRSDLDNSSVHSMSTERMGNESEAECDLILVDRDAWLAAENLRAQKDKEGFDYDSDDTVVLKSRVDSLKSETNDMVMDTVREETPMDISEEGSPNKSSRKSLQKGATPSKDKANEEDVEENSKTMDTHNKSGTKKSDSASSDENTKESKSKLNTSSRKSIGERRLSKSRKIEEMTDDSNESNTNSKLNKSASLDNSLKKRKSLNKSVEVASSQDSDVLNTSEKDIKNKSITEEKEVKPQVESAKKKKSLNKSATKEDETDKTVELDSDDATPRSKRNKSLNTTLTKRTKSKQVEKESSDESNNESKNSEDGEDKHEASMKKQNKKKYQRNYSTLVHVGSDSEVSANNMDSDSNDSKNQSMKMLNLLFAGDSSDDSDNEDEKSIDSDVKREYNLDGENSPKFSDDDVPGDECRASESESSDPDDNGSDLADFVVDDDEVEDEEEEDGDEEENEDEDDNDEKDENGEEEIEVYEAEEVEINEVVEEDEDMADEDAADIKADTHQSDAEDDSEKEDQNEMKENLEDEEVNIEDTDSDSGDEEVVSKSQNTSKKERSQIEKSASSLLSQTPKSAKSKKHGEDNLSDSLVSNSSKKKKMKQKEEDVNEMVEESSEPQLNESAVIFAKKIHKLNQSTPKSSVSKQGKLDTSLQSPSGVLETSRKKSISKNQEDNIENISPAKLQTMNMSLVTETSTKKLSKAKNEEKLLHKSLPSDLIELVEKTNLSRPMSSKITELNRTTLTPHTETPTTKYLKKDKLNESAPAMKIRNDSKKLIKSRLSNQRNTTLMESENDDIESAALSTQSLNVSAKRKSLLNETNDTVETESKRKHKKLKQSSVEKSEFTQSNEEDSQEDMHPENTEDEGKHVSSVSLTRNDTEEVSESANKKKKKKKKKKKTSVEVEEPKTEEDMSQDTVDDKSQTTDEVIVEQKQKKRKKKNKNKDENISEYASTDVDSHVSEKMKKKKKRQTVIEQPDEEPAPILSKKKQKLLKDVPSKPKKESSKLSKKQSIDTQSDSDEAPEAVAFSKAREEALEVIKRTAENIKANKESKKRKQKEHLERVQKEREAKIQKLESKQQSSKVNKVELTKKGIKRLPDEVLENLSDEPFKPLKKRKLLKKENQILPSRSGSTEIQNIHVDDNFIALSSCGGTTQFGVVNLQKIKKKTNKSSAVTLFRQKMLARNARQPVSAYLMYMEKQKASGKNKF